MSDWACQRCSGVTRWTGVGWRSVWNHCCHGRSSLGAAKNLLFLSCLKQASLHLSLFNFSFPYYVLTASRCWSSGLLQADAAQAVSQEDFLQKPPLGLAENVWVRCPVTAVVQEQSVNEIHPFASSRSLGEVATLWIPASAGAGACSRHGGGLRTSGGIMGTSHQKQ